jgi:hypothetical protein
MFNNPSAGILNHTISYLTENLSCVFYGVDVLATRYAFFASYHDLLTDISEAFGVWVAILVLATSALTVLASIQQTLTSTWESSTSDKTQTTTSSLLVTYKTFTLLFSKNRSNL